MPQYSYEALTPEGTVTRGAADASTELELETRLRVDGLYLIRADLLRQRRPGTEEGGSAREPAARKTDGRVSRTELLAFTEYLYGAAQAGLPILSTLEDLESQLESRLMRQVTAEIRHDMVEEGTTLSQALAQHPKIFSKLYIATVEAGEATGQLDYAVGQLVEYLAWQREITLQIRQATLYPMIVLGVMALLIVMLVSVVYPRLQPVFQGFDVDLPLPTRIVMGFGELVQERWPWLIAAAVAIPLVWQLVGRTERGRYAIDSFKLRMPIFGPLVHQLEMARVVTYMGLFYRTGVDLLRGLSLLEQMMTNRRVELALRDARQAIGGGSSIAQALGATRLFPTIVIRSFALGEATGKLDESLDRARAFYAREVPAAVRRMLAGLQPLLIVMLGGVLAVIALSIFLPIIQIYQSLDR